MNFSQASKFQSSRTALASSRFLQRHLGFVALLGIVGRKQVLIRVARSAIALVLCAAGAWALTLVEWHASWRVLVPFAFLTIILLLGFLYGRTVGILGSIIAAGVFAHSMFAPLGSLRVGDQTARSALAWMLLTGVALSFLLLPSSKDHKHHPHSK